MITFVKACTDMYQKTCSLEQYSAIAAYKQQDWNRMCMHARLYYIIFIISGGTFYNLTTILIWTLLTDCTVKLDVLVYN